MRRIVLMALLLLSAAAPGCTRLKGVVLDERGRPHPTAGFSVGRPDGLGARQTYTADARGRFDISLFPLDENNFYVYDRAASPALTTRRIDRFEFSENMKIRLARAVPDEPPMNADPNMPLD